jgi:serine/threonine protein kinase
MADSSRTTHSIKKHNYFQTKELGSGAYGSVLSVFTEDGGNYALKQFKSEYDKEEVEELKEFLKKDNWENDPEAEDVPIFSDISEHSEHSEKEYALFDEETDDEETDHQTPIPGMDTGAMREISILRCLSNIHPADKNYIHPNIITLYDICWFNDLISMVMPKMCMSLDVAIEDELLKNKQKVKIAHGLLSAIDFLHVNNVIHRDVKTDNVLLDDDMKAVLCDFSLTKFFAGGDSKGVTHSPDVGTSTYRAPEQVYEEVYSFSADIWSAGVVILELFNGMIPVELKEKQALRHIQDMRKRFTEKPLPKLLARLLAQQPKHRATSKEALQMELFTKGGYKVPNHTKVLNKLLTPKPKPTAIGGKGGKKKRRNNPAARIARMKKGKLDKKPLTEYEKLARKFEYENPMTCEAAEIYHNKSGEQIIDCMIVASKIYEYWTLDIINDISIVEGFDIERYLLAEKNILMAMDYCLFI